MIRAVNVSVVSGGMNLLAPTSVEVPEGNALLVRGANGVGKSTFLRVLSGKIQPTSGLVRVAGKLPCERNSNFRHLVSSMIGLPPMASDLTIHDHILLVARTWASSRAEALSEAKNILHELNLGSLANRFPHELSSGQTQLFGLSLVLARPFKVLILDEPEQRLDFDRLSLITKVLKLRRDRGATLLIASHSPVLAEALADSTLNLDLSHE